MTKQIAEVTPKLKKLLGYLDVDPDNLPLLSGAADEALSSGRADITQELLGRYANLEPLPGKELNTYGLAYMQSAQYAEAIDIFEALLEDNHTDAALNFNLAWSEAMIKNYEKALKRLDTQTVTALPQAAMLDVQIKHQLGKLQDASHAAKKYMQIHESHQGLLAAISVLAMDVEDIELARQAAEQSGEHPDGLTTLGMLALGDDDPRKASKFFDKALDINVHGPRSWIGKGLSELLIGDAKSGTLKIDRGAEMFGTHIGSWIAAGWAYFILGDVQTAKKRFETAMDLDHNFAESHGALAVIDVLDGNLEKARKAVRTAIGLDKNCFSAILAQSLIISSQGKPDVAKAIFDRGLNTPIDDSGRTLAQSMVKMGLSSP